MSTRANIVSQIGAELKAASSDLLLASPPLVDSSRAFTVLQSYLSAHPLTPASPTAPGSSHPSVEKLANEIIQLYKNTFAPRDQQNHRGYYRLTPDQVSAQDVRLQILVAWLKRLLPIYDPPRFVTDWWEPVLRPVLTTGRWRPLLATCSDIVISLLCSEFWPAHVHNMPVSGVEDFRHLIATTYLVERGNMWEREGSFRDHQNVQENEYVKLPGTRIGAFWDTVCGNNLENVLFSFGAQNPKELFDLLNDFCCAKDRFHVLAFLAKFIKKEEATSYFLVESPLFRTILLSSVYDSNPAVVCAAVSLLTALLPSIVARLDEYNGELLAILVRMVRWEVNFSLVFSLVTQTTAAESHTAERDSLPLEIEFSGRISAAAKAILKEYTCVIVRQTVEDYFTILYGILPCNTVETVKAYAGVKRKSFRACEGFRIEKGTFETAEDPFVGARKQVEELDDFDDEAISSERLMALLANHRVHQDLILSTATAERDALKLSRKSPSDIVMESWALRVQQPTEWSDAGVPPPLQRANSSNSFRSATNPNLEGRSIFEPSEPASAFAILDDGAAVAPHLFPLPRLVEDEENSPLNLTALQNASRTSAARPIPVRVSSLRDIEDARSSTETSGGPAEDAAERVAVSSPPPNTPLYGPDELDLESILVINRRLRTTIFDIKDLELLKSAARKTETIFDPQPRTLSGEVLKLQLMLLLNEINYQAYMRWHHSQYIRKLKKDQIEDDLKEADRQSVFEKLKLQTQEITGLHEHLNRQRQESASMRDRQRRYEEELTKRVRLAKDEVALLKAEIILLHDKIDNGDKEMLEMRARAGVADGHVFELQTELDIATPELAKLKNYEKTIETLTKTLMGRENEVTAEKWKENKQQLLERILALQMQLADVERDLRNAKSDAAGDKSAFATFESKAERLQATVERLEKEGHEQARALEYLQFTTSERVKAVEEKYQTTRKINLQLEVRYRDLGS
ncbi:hypothetical protein HKX48_003046 [Thoreauomyces humboldtii]|nr:hypothetical protein HKX48_003046 [Thoreauomyces humboldtii]